MSFDCKSFCYEKYFLVALFRFSLNKGPHSLVENPKQSLIDCFTEIGSEEDFQSFINDLYFHESQVLVEGRSLYAQGLELEYGLQKHLISTESCPNVAILAELSKEYNLDLYVVCGLLPLRFLRMNGNDGEYDVLRFNFSRIGSPIKIVIGLIGLGIYHKLEQPSGDSTIWESLSRRSIIVDNEVLLGNDIQNDFSYEDHEDHDERMMDNELAMEFNAQLETETHTSQNSTHGNENIPLISMQEFVERFVQNDGNGPILDPEAYNLHEKIDVGLTSIDDLYGQPPLIYEQVVDIDGFFGVFEWKESSVFKGNVKMCSVPKKASPRDVNSFKKLLLDSNNGSDFQGAFFKIATCSTNFGIVDIYFSCFFVCQDGLNVKDELVQGIVKRAFEHGKVAKCWNQVTGNLIHDGCTHRYRGNTDAYRSVENGDFEPVFDCDRYRCFAYHFGRAVVLGLSQFDIRLIHDFCLVKAVGMKFVLLSPTINGVINSVSEISKFFDLNKMYSNFDLCFSTIGHASEPGKSVWITLL
jgi:hypothetical protein